MTLTLYRKICCLLYCTIPFFSISQTVSIEYELPENLTVCDTAAFSVILTNNLSDSIKMVTLEATFPDGLSYVSNSIENGSDLNISNLNQPQFSLPNLGPGDQLTITFLSQTDCSLIASIDAGNLFSNSYAISWEGGSNNLTTIPYDIETALLQILNINNGVQFGTKGDILTRSITFQNTRLGALSKITFTDFHTGGTVEISTDLGMVSINNNQTYQVMLGPNDFMTIGDGDGLFELDEIITITETILITDCGFDEDAVNSDLTISWGCHGEVCQQQQAEALISLLPSPDNPALSFSTSDIIPESFCAEQAAPQFLKITNTGNLPATNIILNVSYPGDTPTAGIVENSIYMDSSGLTFDIPYNTFDEITFEDCDYLEPLAGQFLLNIPILGAGECITINWEAIFCSVDCGTVLPGFRYDYNFTKACPENSTESNMGSSSPPLLTTSLIDSITFNIGENLMDGGIYTMNYSLVSDFIQDSTGNLILDFFLPCGLSWVGAPPILGGVAPIESNTIDLGNGTHVTHIYPSPIGVDSVGSDFLVTFDCGADCIELPECDVENISSCSPENVCIATPSPFFIMSVNSTFDFNPNDDSTCGIKECQTFALTYDCPADSICENPIIGYLDYGMEFYRENLGLPDNDDDRFADQDGEIDLSLIRRDRAMPGDILRTGVEGAVVIDIPGETLSNGLINVQFEAHTQDDGIDGGSVLNFLTDSDLMTEALGIQNLYSNVRIVDASTGESYTCPLGDPIVDETQLAVIQVPNTRPAEEIDRILYMTFSYDISPNSLNALGSDIPLDFEYSEGDSVIFESYHQVSYNVTNVGNPQIVNLRTGTYIGFYNTPPDELQLSPFVCNCQSVFWQLTGYYYSFSPGFYNIPPCDISDEPGGATFEFLLGIGNFFPYEFRHLGKLLEWSYAVNPVATLLESELLYLSLQDGSTLFANETLTPSVEIGPTYFFDIDDFQMPLLDEGYSMEFRHLWDLPCSYSGNIGISANALIDFAPSLLEEFDPLDSVQFHPSAFNILRPLLLLNPENSHYVSLDNTAMWEFDLSHLPSNFNDLAPNVWIMPVSQDGTIQDFELTNLSTGELILNDGGIFQLGDFIVDLTQSYQLTATNLSCNPTTIDLIYGWNCEAFTPLNEEPCWSETVTLTVESPPGEIEMDIISPVGPFNLCDTISHHTVEIFNAQMGSVYNVRLETILPNGLHIVPGSSELAYPTGTGYFTVDDPTDLGNGVFQWDISELSSDVGIGGLAGFQFAPDHSVSLRFLSTTECGFIAGSFLEFTAKATQNCEDPTNELSKASNPILIEGVALPYLATIDIEAIGSTEIFCGEEFSFMVNLFADGATLAQDSVFIFLPQGATYVEGSYSPGSNALSQEPFVDLNAGQTILKWPLQEGIPPNTSINFGLSITGLGFNDCENDFIQVKTLQKQEALCIADGSLCSVLVETGSEEIVVSTAYPEFDLLDLQTSGTNNNVNFNLTILNNGASTGEPVLIDFYIDNDGDGQLSNGDDYISSSSYGENIAAGETFMISGNVIFPTENLCNLIAVMNADNNCTCNSDAIGAPNVLENTLPTESLCTGISDTIGLMGQANNSYLWTPSEFLSCDNCPNPTFQAENTGSEPVVYTYQLVEQSTTGCTITHTQLVVVHPIHEILEPAGNEVLCEGDQLSIIASSGAENYEWSGPNIISEDEHTILIAPTENAVYTLTVTGGGCENTETIEVQVIGNALFEESILCPGDSIEFDGVVYYEDALTPAVDTIVDGCPTSLSLDIIAVDTFGTGLVTEICIAEGASFEISLNEVFESYSWTPSNDALISCSDCPNPTITPLTSADSIYTVIAVDQNGCEVIDQTVVTLLPPCSVDLLEMPNAFTPNGDGINDTFGPVLDDNLIKIFEEDGVSVQLTIWNRWGQKVYENSGITARWDGFFNSKASTDDVFIYLLEVNCGGGSEKLKGDFTMIR